MPLPNGDTQWPPKSMRNVRAQMDEWDAWYAGDPERLHDLYQHGEWRPRALQYAGGIAGKLARLWWGRPAAAGEPSEKLHIPVAADLCSTSADLLFSEPPKFRVQNEKTQAFLDGLTDDGMHATLLAAADTQAALGGTYLRAVWDKDVSGLPWLDRVDADCAVPEFRYGRLWAVTFWRVLENDGTEVWRHLERHEPGAIMHGLYVGGPERDLDSGALGRRVDLTAHPETAGIAKAIDANGDTITTGITARTAYYVPNQRPTRRWRKDAAFSRLGRSDFEGLEGPMDKFDFVWSCWMRDIDLAKGRLIVPAYYLQSQGAGKGAVFDPDQRVFSPVNMMPPSAGDAGNQLTIAQFAIRVEEHSRSASELLEQILRGGGYSAQTFGVAGEPMQTATEIQARERRSLLTKARKALPYRPELAEAGLALLELSAAMFGHKITPERPAVTFADSVQEDPLRLAQTADMLRQARAASTETLVRLVNPDWDDKRVLKEVEGIAAEDALSNPDTFDRPAEDDSEGTEGEA